MDARRNRDGMSGNKILIADSNTSDRQRLSKRLVGEGYEVIQAMDGAETVRNVHSHKPDLVLLNTSFPPDVANGGGAFCDGLLIIEWLKQLKDAKPVRIILISNEDAAKVHDKARVSGALGLFQKPINEESLVSVVQQILGGMPPQSGWPWFSFGSLGGKTRP